MSGILQAWFGAMLICLPISFVLALSAEKTAAWLFYDTFQNAWMAIWAVLYSVMILAITIAFAIVLGVAVLLGAL